MPNTEASSGWRWRASLIAPLAQAQDGVVHRAQLRERGIGHDAVRTEVRAGRWRVAGRHTVVVGPGGSTAALWRDVWESGPGARLDGAAALVAQGMTGFVLEFIDVTVRDRAPARQRCSRGCGCTDRDVLLRVSRSASPESGPSGRRSMPRDGRDPNDRRHCSSAFPCSNAWSRRIG